ncbi:L,D-transpeptidase [Frankia canadensis]|uniref:L,D-transpeptidase n=1 Tax=Frankia canadensis TaxID=1836972 RepID=UPI001FAE8946|nr:L,D-transpeptidase [Frankia canadensis]
MAGAPAGRTLVAVATQDVSWFAGTGGSAAGLVIASVGMPASLPVIDQRPGWLRVRLPQRPNGSTGWLRRAGVGLTSTPYRIEVDALAARLRLYYANAPVLDVPAGVGTREHPTPTGSFYITRVVPPARAGFGDLVLVTSAHSPTATDYDDSLDASVAIHGPLDTTADVAIGTRGAHIARGCVRLHLADLDRLREVPPGTPVDILTEVAV